MTPVQIVMVGSFLVLLAAKVGLGRDLSWTLVTSPLWIPYAFLAALYALIWILTKIIFWLETPEERERRLAVERARHALEAFKKRHVDK